MNLVPKPCFFDNVSQKILKNSLCSNLFIIVAKFCTEKNAGTNSLKISGS
jgi:hypothetical protein